MLDIFQNQEVFSLIFKAFAVVLSIFYLIFSFVLARQVKIMNQGLLVGKSFIFAAITSLQIILAFLLVILAVVFV